MKKTILSLVAIVAISTSSFAASITNDNKSTTSAERSGSKSASRNNSNNVTESKNRSQSLDKSDTLSNSQNWSRTISKNKGYSLTKDARLAVTLDLFPIIQSKLTKMFPNDRVVQLGNNVFLTDLGFKEFGDEYATSDTVISYFNSLAASNKSVENWDKGTSLIMNYRFTELNTLAYLINEVAMRLQYDKKLTAYNLDQKIASYIYEVLPDVNKKLKSGYFNIRGECWFSSTKSWSCQNREYTLAIDERGIPSLQQGSFVIIGKGLIEGKSLSMSLTLGKTLSEGLNLASADSKSRGAVYAAKKALNVVKTKGKTKSTVIALSKTLNKLIKEGEDSSSSRSLSTNPIK